jgi:hypothetical protein
MEPAAPAPHWGEIMKHHLNAGLVALSIFGFGIMALPIAPQVWAAELALKPAKGARVHAVRHKRPLLRDYDGTLIRLGHYNGRCATYPVQIATEARLRYISDGAVQRCRRLSAGLHGRFYW